MATVADPPKQRAATNSDRLQQDGARDFGAPPSESQADNFIVAAPGLSLPKGGGAIRGIGEKFAVNPVTGTSSMTVPIFASPGRSGFGSQLALSYDSGSGNGPFGLGWTQSLPGITRRTDRGLPRYMDGHDTARSDSDIFVLSGSEDLVNVLMSKSGAWATTCRSMSRGGQNYQVFTYRPRTESTFARIERWLSIADPADHFWRSISRDNTTTWYGLTRDSRIADPDDPARIFHWLISESYDDKGNAMLFSYKSEDGVGIDPPSPPEVNRLMHMTFP